MKLQEHLQEYARNNKILFSRKNFYYYILFFFLLSQVWYDLPSDVFFNAISSIDRFLAKMKAQPKHLSCIAVAAFHLACMQHQKLQQEQLQPNPVAVPEPLDLVNISQSRCSPSGMLKL